MIRGIDDTDTVINVVTCKKYPTAEISGKMYKKGTKRVDESRRSPGSEKIQYRYRSSNRKSFLSLTKDRVLEASLCVRVSCVQQLLQ